MNLFTLVSIFAEQEEMVVQINKLQPKRQEQTRARRCQERRRHQGGATY